MSTEMRLGGLGVHMLLNGYRCVCVCGGGGGTFTSN